MPEANHYYFQQAAKIMPPGIVNAKPLHLLNSQVREEPRSLRLTKGEFVDEVPRIFHWKQTANRVALRLSMLLELAIQGPNQLFASKPGLRSRKNCTPPT